MVPTGKIAANILNIPVISGVDDEGRWIAQYYKANW
jgi:hypothetical protein